MKIPVYLDYASTTPVDPKVAAAMAKCLTLEGTFGNPASRSHVYGWQAESAVENARRQVADLINADPREIVWTSGATEADNLALKGAAYYYRSHSSEQSGKRQGAHIVTSKIEHKAVLDTCKQLENEGFEVSYITPDRNGIIAPETVREVLRDDTVLVSIMHVNNEIGVINDIAGIGEVCRDHGAVFHVDAAQSFGKIALDMTTMKVDLLSMSAHKVYGPKGIGALYVRRTPRVMIQAQMHGGGHERGMRSGTLPTHQIVGMGEAAHIAMEVMAEENQRLLALRERFLRGINNIEAVTINGSLEQGIAGNVNVSFAFVEGETLLTSLRDLAVSTGSACTSASVEPSYVLSALGVDPELAHSSIRFSFGRYTTEDEIDFAIAKVTEVVAQLRDHNPAWQRRVQMQSA